MRTRYGVGILFLGCISLSIVQTESFEFMIILVLCKQVRLGEPGWKERYYMEKFEARTPEEMEEFRKDVVSSHALWRCNYR